MASQKQFREIKSLLFQGNFDEAFRKARYLDERSRRPVQEILYLGSLSLFGLGHIRQAESWIEKFNKNFEDTTAGHYLNAYLNLHLGNMDQALLHYTRILETDPSDTFADSVIERLRIGAKAIQRDFENPGSFRKYFPEFKRDDRSSEVNAVYEKTQDRFKMMLAALTLSGMAVMFVIGYYFLPMIDMNFFDEFEKNLPQPPAHGSIIPEREFVSEKPKFLYTTGDEALTDYSNARKLIVKGFVNQAMYLLGKIELSNADFEIKERARLLRDFIPVVEPHEFADPVTIEEILKEPYIYRGAQVLWEGEIVSSQPMGQNTIRLILAKNELHKPPFMSIDVESRSGISFQPGNRVSVFGIFQKVRSEEVIEIRVVRIRNLNGGK